MLPSPRKLTKATLKLNAKYKPIFRISSMKIQDRPHLTNCKVPFLLNKHNKHHLTILCRIKAATCCFLQPPNQVFFPSFLSRNLLYTSNIRKRMNLSICLSISDCKTVKLTLSKKKKEQVWYFTITSATQRSLLDSRTSFPPSFSTFLLVMRLIFPVALNSLDLTDMENVTENL